MKTNQQISKLGNLKIFFTLSISVLAIIFSNNANSQTIKSMDEQLKELQATEIKSGSKTNNSESQKLQSLYYNYNPGLVINSGELKNKEVSNPVVLDLNIKDISGLYKRNSEFATIEMIRFNVVSKKDITALSIDKLVGFNSLKYVVFQCGFDCDSEFVKSNLLSGNPTQKISVLYLVSIPE